MYSFKKILVCLDLSEMDDTLIEFAKFISETSQCEKIYFVNYIRDFNLPERVAKEFPGLLKGALKDRQSQIVSKVESIFPQPDHIEFKYTFKKGQPAKKVLSLANEKDIDLILVGRKNNLKGTGVFSNRLARRASCSLLIVPEGSKPTSHRFLVPSDFSDYSVIAMEQAIQIAERSKDDTEIICQNVFSVPVGYHYSGKSFEEFGDRMQEYASKDYQQFISKIDLKGQDVRPIYTLDEDDDPVGDIYEMGVKLEVSAIIIGAKGRTATTALFLGSMAEELIQINSSVPLLIVRPKGKNAGILDYLKEL
jgi:nucleotide-binding universal stress UspA family protein